MRVAEGFAISFAKVFFDISHVVVASCRLEGMFLRHGSIEEILPVEESDAVLGSALSVALNRFTSFKESSPSTGVSSFHPVADFFETEEMSAINFVDVNVLRAQSDLERTGGTGEVAIVPTVRSSDGNRVFREPIILSGLAGISEVTAAVREAMRLTTEPDLTYVDPLPDPPY